VLDVIDQLDPEPFLRAYRIDGHGHPAYDPKLLLGVLLYAYAVGVRSSRQIERRPRRLAGSRPGPSGSASAAKRTGGAGSRPSLRRSSKVESSAGVTGMMRLVRSAYSSSIRTAQ
jgi:Transposase domain (DUF772)